MTFWLTYLQQSHIRELVRAGRKEEADRAFREVTDAAQTPQQVMSAMQFAGYRSDRETIRFRKARTTLCRRSTG